MMEINISYFSFELTFDSSFCSATCPVFAFHYFFVTSMYTCPDTMLKRNSTCSSYSVFSVHLSCQCLTQMCFLYSFLPVKWLFVRALSKLNSFVNINALI